VLFDLSIGRYVSLVFSSVLTIVAMRIALLEWMPWTGLTLIELVSVVMMMTLAYSLACQRTAKNHQLKLLERERARLHHELMAQVAMCQSQQSQGEPELCAGLTGCLRLSLFLESGRLELKRAQRYHRSLALIMLNINEFKACNEQLGPALADRVLILMAQRLGRLTRHPDLLSHIRDDQFVVLLPETDLYQALDVGERIQADLSEEFQMIFKPKQPITVRLGVACLDLQQMQDIEALLSTAEEAMNNSRHQVVLPYSRE
jgi:diguanylate cyclase (GGDEF)-like protein